MCQWLSHLRSQGIGIQGLQKTVLLMDPFQVVVVWVVLLQVICVNRLLCYYTIECD